METNLNDVAIGLTLNGNVKAETNSNTGSEGEAQGWNRRFAVEWNYLSYKFKYGHR